MDVLLAFRSPVRSPFAVVGSEEAGCAGLGSTDSVLGIWRSLSCPLVAVVDELVEIEPYVLLCSGSIPKGVLGLLRIGETRSTAGLTSKILSKFETNYYEY